MSFSVDLSSTDVFSSLPMAAAGSLSLSSTVVAVMPDTSPPSLDWVAEGWLGVQYLLYVFKVTSNPLTDHS